MKLLETILCAVGKLISNERYESVDLLLTTEDDEDKRVALAVSICVVVRQESTLS